MNSTEIAMYVLVVSASAFVGVIAAMMGVIQAVLNQLDYVTYTRVMKGIIVSGRKSPVIWSLLLIPPASAVTTLVLLRNEIASAPFVWPAIGLVLFFIGPILFSQLGNGPWYGRPR